MTIGSQRVTIYASWTLTNEARNKVWLRSWQHFLQTESTSMQSWNVQKHGQHPNHFSHGWTHFLEYHAAFLHFLQDFALIRKRGKYFFSKRPKTLFLQEIMTSVKDDGLTSNEKNNEHFSSTIFISLERPNISQICSIYKGGEVRRFIKIFSPILPSYF